MIINLLGPHAILHPYADRERDTFSVLTYDTRKDGLTSLFNGLVYEEVGGSHKHILQDDLCMVCDGVLRTVVPVQTSKVFKCGHVWIDPALKGEPEKERQRISTIKLQDGMLVVQDDKNIVLADLSLDIELHNPELQTLWDHLKL